MCSHYQAVKTRERYRQHFDIEPPSAPSKQEVWPRYVGSFIRKHPQGDAGHDTLAQLEALSGLVPHWATDTKITRHTYNARIDTAAEKPSFRDAWKLGQHCIIPAQGIYEPDWRSGKAVPTLIEHADEEPMGIAGLWSSWKSDKGELVFSYTMLTINADQHPLMKQFHKPFDENAWSSSCDPINMLTGWRRRQSAACSSCSSILRICSRPQQRPLFMEHCLDEVALRSVCPAILNNQFTDIG